MVCIAAFIILALLSVFVGILSLFRRDIGAKYWKTFKKAWGCVGKKVRLQKCETNFKSEIKNSLLARVVVKKPKLVKPLSVGIEVLAVLIVAVTVWSVVEGAKAGLSLWVFGTCNVSQPSNCSLTSDVCGIDQAEPKNIIEATGRWFTEWGEIFGGIPDRVKRWDAKFYLPQNTTYWSYDANRPTALDVFDPGCAVCLASFRNQRADGFFERQNVTYVPYIILNPSTGEDRFANSRLVGSYLVAIRSTGLVGNGVPYDWRLLERIFLESDSNGVNYQEAIKRLEPDAVRNLLESWLLDFGALPDQISHLRTVASDPSTAETLESYRQLVDEQIHAKGIPTMIYDGRKHTGLYQ